MILWKRRHLGLDKYWRCNHGGGEAGGAIMGRSNHRGGGAGGGAILGWRRSNHKLNLKENKIIYYRLEAWSMCELAKSSLNCNKRMLNQE